MARQFRLALSVRYAYYHALRLTQATQENTIIMAYEDRIAEIEAQAASNLKQIEALNAETVELVRELRTLADTRPSDIAKAIKDAYAKAKSPLKLGKGGGRNKAAKTTPVVEQKPVAVAAE